MYTGFEIDLEKEEDHLNDLRQLSAVLVENEPDTYNASLKCPPDSELSPTLQQVMQIESAMSLNRSLYGTATELQSSFVLRLHECRERLKIVQDQIKTMTMADKPEIFRYINCGRPYFKDKLNFPAPDNEDALLAKSQMYDFSLVVSVPGWTVKDKSQFMNQIHKMSQERRRAALNSQISRIRRENPDSSEREAKILTLQKQIDNIKSLPFLQLALPLDEEYDWDLLANQLNKRHTAQEYRSLWKLFFHPSINKNSWSKSEHIALQKIAADKNHQDWDSIAMQLNTGRTGYQCFVYHRTNMSSSVSGKRWTNEEVTYLKRLIDYFKEDNYIPWGKIAAAMENRTKIQIYNKYMRLIEHRKGRFLPEEDSVILNCAGRFGSDFRRMTNYLPGRSMVQIRARYFTLKKLRISTVWTVEDDRKLMQIMNNQDTLNFAEVTKYFPGKNRTNIRTRYVILTRWTKKYPNLDLEHAPRRGARRLCHGKPSEDLNKAIENLKNILSSEVETKSNKKKLSLESSETDIEDAIMALLFTEQYHASPKKKTEQTSPINETLQGNVNVTNLQKVLIFLNSHLNKELYENSDYSNIYPNLGGDDQETSLIKVKSYSRKNNVETIKIHGTPDVWGKVSLNRTSYVLPPHYATITGLKSLMSHISLNKIMCESVDINALIRKNPLLKQQYQLLQDRFYTLFLWPMLLSNEGPMDFCNMKKHVLDSFHVEPSTLPRPPEAPIKKSWMKEYKCAEVASNIDLVDIPEKEKSNDCD